MPAWNGKPSILVIGDSISIGYTPTIQAALPNYEVVHNPCNAMTSTWTNLYVEDWLSERASFDAITWNNGLWDIASWIATSDADYIANLHTIAQKLKAKSSNVLFITTTEVLPGTQYRNNADVIHKNSLAVTVMGQEGIPVLDLYSYSTTIQNEHVTPTDVHFTETGYQLLGQQVLNALSANFSIP